MRNWIHFFLSLFVRDRVWKSSIQLNFVHEFVFNGVPEREKKKTKNRCLIQKQAKWCIVFVILEIDCVMLNEANRINNMQRYEMKIKIKIRSTRIAAFQWFPLIKSLKYINSALFVWSKYTSLKNYLFTLHNAQAKAHTHIRAFLEISIPTS